MVVWWSAEGELTDIQRLDIWSPPSWPLQATFSCPVCVCVFIREKEEVDKNIIYVFFYMYYLFDNLGKKELGVGGGREKRPVDAY